MKMCPAGLWNTHEVSTTTVRQSNNICILFLEVGLHVRFADTSDIVTSTPKPRLARNDSCHSFPCKCMINCPLIHYELILSSTIKFGHAMTNKLVRLPDNGTLIFLLHFHFHGLPSDCDKVGILLAFGLTLVRLQMSQLYR